MNKIYKIVLAVAATTIVASASLAPVAVNAWGDSDGGRPTYTLESVGELGNTITFNSITNGKIGDERNFVGAKLSNSNQTAWNADEITVKDGDVLTIRLYVHNNNPGGTSAIAEGVSASFALPNTVGKSQTITGYLYSSNAAPTRYWDEVVLNSSSAFYLEYVEGSAKYTNASADGKERTFKLSDDVISSGVTLGYDKMDGKIPGCYAYDGQVTIQVKVHTEEFSKISKTVRIKGNKGWNETVNAKVGDEVEYQIEYRNLLNGQVDNVMIYDTLPANMEYVAGSTMLYNSNYQEGVKVVDDTVTTTGINIGSYIANGNAYVRFTAKVVSKSLKCGDNKLVNWAAVMVNSLVVKDDASVVVNYDAESCHAPEPEPELPIELPNTGVTGAAGAALGAGSIVTALGYFVASRKKLM